MSTPETKFDPYRLQGQYAGFVTRLVAFVIDLVILSAIYGLSISVIQLIGDFLDVDFFNIMTTQPFVGTLVGFIAVVFPIMYYVFFWALSGQTPGKAIMGVRILGVNGERITVVRALLRYGGYWLSAGGLMLGFLWVLADNRRQTFHDKLARTVVVYSWEARIHKLVVERAKVRASTPRKSHRRKRA